VTTVKKRHSMAISVKMQELQSGAVIPLPKVNNSRFKRVKLYL
jgi:hypothetical protein